VRINRLLLEAQQALLLRVSAIEMRSDPKRQRNDALLETAGRFCTENSVLWPLTAVDVSLGVVIADGFFFGNVVCVAGDPRAFGRREVCALCAGAGSELRR
jgi:hypothetical protein